MIPDMLTWKRLTLFLGAMAAVACAPNVAEEAGSKNESVKAEEADALSILDLIDAVQMVRKPIGRATVDCAKGACCDDDGYFRPRDFACRIAEPNHPCDTTEFCTGESSECPGDTFAARNQACRPANPSVKCDVPEFCTGDSPMCPPDSFAPPTQVCRPALVGAGCDEAEFCSGDSPFCPPDLFASQLRACRPKDAENACDVAEFCSGHSSFCPDDTPAALGSGGCERDAFDLGLHDFGIANYGTLFFGLDAGDFSFVTSPKQAGIGAARLISGKNGLTRSFGIGARLIFKENQDINDFTRIAYAVRSNHATPNVKVALEVLIDSGGENESTWRQRVHTQLNMADIAGGFETVLLTLNRDDFERTDGGYDTQFDLRQVSALQFLMLIEPGTVGTNKQAAIYVDELRFTDKWLLAEYATEKTNTPVQPEIPASIGAFDVGTAERLAVFVSDASAQWLGVVHGMKALGVPLRVTTDPSEALKHKVIFAYPRIPDDAVLEQAFREHVQDGGTLLAGEAKNAALKDVFGFEQAEFVPASSRFYQKQEISSVHLTHAYPALTGDLVDPRERRIPIFRRELGINVPGWRYGGTAEPAVAVYDDAVGEVPENVHNNVAITYNRFGSGNAYALGLDLGLYVLRNFNGRGGGIARNYINGFEPGVDVLLRLVREIYVSSQEWAVTVATLPGDHSLAVMLTHDIDTSDSVSNAMLYAEAEHVAGVPATYFVQTKYTSDAQESAFWGTGAFEALAKMRSLGMEVASHSVAHARNFNEFELGDGTEQYQSYRPVNVDADSGLMAVNGTVLGELRVSKFLLEDFVHDVGVISFRPGHLRQPSALSQAMKAVGYRYGSIASASNALTHLPHKMTYDRGFEAEVQVFDFPVTIEDERPDSPIVMGRVEDALAVADKISRNGGILVMLVHPNALGAKLEFVKDFIDQSKDKYLFTTVGEFGRWWERRDAVEMHSVRHGDILQVTLHVPMPIADLTLELPPGVRLSGASQPIVFSDLPDQSKLVVTSEISGELQLFFRATRP